MHRNGDYYRTKEDPVFRTFVAKLFDAEYMSDDFFFALHRGDLRRNYRAASEDAMSPQHSDVNGHAMCQMQGFEL